ncbi:hypothetical protein V6N11_056472 [Hibiscus sabdariffa]|uniref:Uncharacterized protein n=1 Tax=Hibiscus sabdariffa TaxID=183260 RepID=A0ABR2T4J4_9ROSI
MEMGDSGPLIWNTAGWGLLIGEERESGDDDGNSGHARENWSGARCSGQWEGGREWGPCRVVETAIAATKSVAWLLMVMGTMPNGINVLIKEPEAHAGFPLDLLAVRKSCPENKDAGDTEDDDDDDEEDEAAGDEDEDAGEEEDGSGKDDEGEDGGDPEDEPEANGDGANGDEDDEDDDDNDDDGGEDEEEEEEEEDEEEEELQPPAKRRK